MNKIDYSEMLTKTPDELLKLQKSNGCIMYVFGLIVYNVLLMLGYTPSSYKGVCPYFTIGDKWGGFSLGWFFICDKSSGEHTKMHEVGHCIQTAYFKGLTMPLLSLCSAGRYWYRRIFKIETPYDSWWFEGDASRIGREYINKRR